MVRIIYASWLALIEEVIDQGLRQQLYERPGVAARLADLKSQVADGTLSSTISATEVRTDD